MGFPTQVNAEFKVVFQFQGSMTPVDENVDKEFNNQNNFTMFDQKITFKKFLKGKKLDKPRWDLNF